MPFLSSKIKVDSHSEEAIGAMKEAVHNWLEAIGLDAASTAASVAPVDTGRLKNSISHQVVDAEDAVYIGTNVEYAPYQEFGTSRGVAGKHYLQFGATAHTEEYKTMLENALKDDGGR